MRWFRSNPSEYSYPLERSFDRKLASDFAGEVYTWDVDNTYLRTELASFRAMLAIPFEMAIDKKPFPGVPELLQEIRRGPGLESRETPLFFVSASPTQMRGVLERRMLLDGIQQDGFTLRDWGKILRGGNFRKLKDPVGYKLAALLLNRMEMPPTANELLFGDDTERDARIYTLYSDILSGRLRGEALRLGMEDLPPEDAGYVLKLSAQVPALDKVRAIFIHMARGRGPGDTRPGQPPLYAVADYFQAALVLRWLEQIGANGLERVAGAVAAAGRELQQSFADAWTRNLLPKEVLRELGRPIACTPPEAADQGKSSIS